jgi:two-component system, response regulator PdtaR
MTRSILLVDPDEAYRRSIARSLDGQGSRIAGEATNPNEAMRLAAITKPEVALIATSLRNGDAIHLVGRLATELGIPSVLLASAADQPSIYQAAEAGAMGLIVRPANPVTLHAMLELAFYRFRDILALRREGQNLRRALEDRKLVERGKGLLMEMENISEPEAFARIRQKSMDTQRSMAEIARAIILAAEVSGRTR